VAITSCQFIYTTDIGEGVNNLIDDNNRYEKRKERKHENTKEGIKKEKRKHIILP